MKIFIFSLVLVSIVLSGDIPPYQEYWYNQTLDHFNPTDYRTFQQKYLVYEGDWDYAKNVIFFYAGNEGPITNFWQNTGFMFDIAPEFGALVVFGEQRYYGDTKPFGDDYSVKNLAYLTDAQTVADYAQLMRDTKIAYKMPNASVIVFGGSQGGVLATLLRIHYPDIFSMALASSAPIPQTMNQINGTTFFYSVTNAFEEYNSKCPDIVRQGYAELIQAGNDNEWDLIAETFQLCPNSAVDDQDDLTYLIEWSRNAYLTMAMVNYPYAADFEGSLPAWPVHASCDVLLEYESTPMIALAKSAGFFYNASESNTLQCYDIYEEYIWCADQTGCSPGQTDFLAWDFEMCTEINYPMITNNVTDMFPPSVWDMNNLTDYCWENYKLIPSVEFMEMWYPLNFSNMTDKIIFSNGLLDPWHLGGYLTPPGGNKELPTVIIPSGAHHLDLRGSNPADPEDVIEARKQEVKILKKWLAGCDHHHHHHHHKDW